MAHIEFKVKYKLKEEKSRKKVALRNSAEKYIRPTVQINPLHDIETDSSSDETHVDSICTTMERCTAEFFGSLPRSAQLGIFYVSVLILASVGGLIFHLCEYQREQESLEYKIMLREKLEERFNATGLKMIDTWSQIANEYSENNKWEFRYSVFFAVSTFTTIGFGDFQAPKTNIGRLFVILYGAPAIVIYVFLAHSIDTIGRNKACFWSTDVYERHRVKVYIVILVIIFLLTALLIEKTATDKGFGNGIYSYWHAWYFLWTTTSTIGYGDVMMSGGAPIVTCMVGIWIFSALGVFLTLLVMLRPNYHPITLLLDQDYRDQKRRLVLQNKPLPPTHAEKQKKIEDRAYNNIGIQL